MSKSSDLRESLFVAEYLKDQNGKRSAIVAGYSAKCAENAASRLLRRAHVREAIKAHQKEALDSSLITVQSLITDIHPILKSKDSKDSDKINAAEFIAKLLGLITQKRELTGRNGTPLVPQGPPKPPIDLSKADDSVLLALIAAKGTVPSSDAPTQD